MIRAAFVEIPDQVPPDLPDDIRDARRLERRVKLREIEQRRRWSGGF